jgi:hypothetical protein
MTARERMRLRPSRSFATGSCATATITVFRKKRRPISRSDTPASFFANTGKSSICA